MKNYYRLIAAFAVIFIWTICSVNATNFVGDDTIKISLGNSSEFKIFIQDSSDINELQDQLRTLSENIDEVIDQVFTAMEDVSIDTTLNLYIKKQDDEIIVDIRGDDSIIEDEIIIEEYDFEDSDFSEFENYEFEDYDYSFDEDYEDYWNQYTKKNYRKVRHHFHFDYGFNNYLEGGRFPGDDNAQYNVKPFGSWNINVGGFLRFQIARPFSLDLGYNFTWYNFKYQDKSTRVTKGEEEVIFSKADGNANYFKSKTAVPYFNLSITPTFHISKADYSYSGGKFKMRIGAGMYAGYRIGGRVKYVYSENSTRSKDKLRGDYFLSTFRYGVKAIVGFGNNFDLYATYDLNTLYAKDRGPKLNPICFGISLTI